jgi:hypothetical protein
MMHHYKLVGVQSGEGAHCKKCMEELIAKREIKTKTYNSGYSLVVTHLTTNPPVRCLNRAERTGSLVLNVLWSYVEVHDIISDHNANKTLMKLIAFKTAEC